MIPHFTKPSGIVFPELPHSTPYQGNSNFRLSDIQIRKLIDEVALSPYDNSVLWSILSHTNDLLARSIEMGIGWLKEIERSNSGKLRKSLVDAVNQVLQEKDGKQLCLFFGE